MNSLEKKSILMENFNLNLRDQEVRQLTYAEILLHYVLKKKI